jgi:hypothetical protein
VVFRHADGGRFHPGFILADPYASRVVPVRLPEAAYTAAPRVPPSYDLNKPVLMGSLSSFTQVGRQGWQRRAAGRATDRCTGVCLPPSLQVGMFLQQPIFQVGPCSSLRLAPC